MRVLVAPQEFKGTLSADEAADAIARGLRRTHPGWEIDLCPLSDGGPGFIDAIRRAARVDTWAVAVHDPLGRPVLARLVQVRGTGIVAIEAAHANGLMHVAAAERDALAADTFGVGELVQAALAVRPPQLLIGVGGSATTDGGAGMARALGARFLDAEGRDLGPGGGPLVALARIQWERPALRGTEIVVATDVTNPLVGPAGAAVVYAPQKGATPAQVEQLAHALARYAEVVRRDLGVDVATLPGGGAAGGLAAGLVAFLGARIASGFDVVAAALAVERRVREADLVITGEGSFDEQSLQGKVTGRMIALAEAAGRRCVVFAGRCGLAAPPLPVATLLDRAGDAARAEREAARWLEELAAAL